MFGWAEEELAKVVARNNDDSLPDADKDFGAKNFLECIIGLKTVRACTVARSVAANAM